MNDRLVESGQPVFSGLIGVARADITPPVGIYCRNWGAAAHDAATAVHRPLTVTVLVLKQSEQDSPFVLAALDLCAWKGAEEEGTLRGSLLEALQLHADHVLLNLSHTHSAPIICHDDSDREGGEYLAGYAHQVQAALIACARDALANCRAATLDWGYGKCDLARNRDMPDPAQPRLLCGFNPDAPADDTLLVGRVCDREGMVMATLANYACHPTTLGWDCDQISPDFVGAMRELIERQTAAPCLFLQGASGDLGPREGFCGDPQVADKNGRQLGYAVLSALTSLLPVGNRLSYHGVVESGTPLANWVYKPVESTQTLSSRHLRVELPLKPGLPSLEEITTDKAHCNDRALLERLERKERIRRRVGEGPGVESSVWIWQIGEAFLVAQCPEAYSWLQAELRRKFAGRAIAVLGVTNGTIGYLPPDSLYDEDVYQVWQTPFGRGSLELLEKSIASEITQLARTER